ncbi:primase-helicase family protein [Acetobacter sp. DsW_063]|uniref:primase-helicase family protein n=1 Tax=Acetobacter sp. DsW_063 TaxID=1514894 RepID=UPI000A3A1E13|nr:primase-helicase family protein [Acetobacter sp. DsW_063]OUJ15027.1 hypothetical protein HK28_10560 [Acetobacter sp. DsW_063]
MITDPVELELFEEATRNVLKVAIPETERDGVTVWRADSHTWSYFKKPAAAAKVIVHDLNDELIDEDFVTWVFAQSQFHETCAGDGYFPMGPQSFMEDGKLFRNTWRDTGIKIADDDQPWKQDEQDTIAEFINKIIRINLANKRGEKTFDELMDILHDEKNEQEFEFRFIMHQIAQNYMRPGSNLKTNMALVGRPGGMGKNLLENYMRRLLGETNVAKPQNIEGKFNSWSVGSSLVVLNEVLDRTGGLNELIKKVSIDEYVSFEQKGVDQKTARNLSNYWIFSNLLSPYKTDDTERRTVFIRTFNDPLIGLADTQRTNTVKYTRDIDDENMCRLLAKFIHYMWIDEELINTWHRTEVSDQLTNDAKSLIHDFLAEEKLSDLLTEKFVRGSFYRYNIKKTQFFEQYQSWCERNGHEKPNARQIKSEMYEASSFFGFASDRIWLKHENVLEIRNDMRLDEDTETHDRRRCHINADQFDVEAA